MSHFVGFVVLVVVIVVILSAYPHYSWYVNIIMINWWFGLVVWDSNRSNSKSQSPARKMGDKMKSSPKKWQTEKENQSRCLK